MPDSRPPRIRVTLPGDAPGTLHGWRQDRDGRWWGRVEVWAPAEAVQQVPGEDYTQVPRTPREPADGGVEYVLATDTRDIPPTMELHKADCWAIEQPARWRRITPVPSPAEARGMLSFPDTTACETCNPEP